MRQALKVLDHAKSLINIFVTPIEINCNLVLFPFTTFTILVINLLFNRIYITRFLSAILLILFAVSITPKKFLHNIFAKHIDYNSTKSNAKPYQINKSGYNCDVENLVAEPTFVRDHPSFEFVLFSFFATYIVKDISLSSFFPIYSPLRGPPVDI